MAYKISADRYVEICKKTMKRKTMYRNEPPWNCGYYDGAYLYGDCWCFNPKVILWSDSVGDPVCDNYTVGKYYYFDGIAASGMPDTVGDVIMQQYCTPVSFAQMLANKKAPCLLLITGHHMGAYIGEWTSNGRVYNTCEFTPNAYLGNGLCPSYCDENGARRVCKGGTIIGYWNKAGYLTSFVDYSKSSTSNSAMSEKHYSTEELAQRIINGVYGSGEDRKNALRTAGYTDAEITAAQNLVNKLMDAATEEDDKHFAGVSILNSGSNGLDISHHNGEVDFAKVKQAGISFIIPRDGWGEDGDDRKFLDYVKQAKENGISVPGIYHFIYAANKEQVIQNAQRAIQNVQKAGLPKTTVIWCDLEYDTVDNARDYRGTVLTPAMQKEFIETFCDYILSQGYPTGAYVNQDYLYRVLGLDFGKKYDLWLADYEGEALVECVYRQTGAAPVNGCPYQVDTDEYYGQYTAGTAKPKTASDDIAHGTSISNKTEEAQKEVTPVKIAVQILDNVWGNNPTRKTNITAKYGADMYRKAQDIINKLMAYKTDCDVAVEILNGKWGNNPARKKDITAAYGADTYTVAQGYINSGYTKEEIANGYKVAVDILRGKYGNNPERKNKITSAYNAHVYDIAQGIIDGIMK